MTERNNGGPAFPQPINPGEYGRGMTLRDYFAAQAMQGMISSGQRQFNTGFQLAAIAYSQADAMLEARK